MLQIQHICKQYTTGKLVQKALDDVSLNFRDNEFVAILGPSGSGKTTLLNIVGGLDHYDSGDLIINGISTQKYKDRDWDSYRNHTIGFVFQGYNLIPHQTILSNVELALTISGIGKAERKKRARHALTQVGLGEQTGKLPNQLSGGQMQRVAIARALVNDPDILLADEPTGALDSETSIQVMDLLKEVAHDRLVVMVTHNPELAHEYATRIIELRDGKIRSDSDPLVVDAATLETPTYKNMGKAAMSFLTALALSFNNLRTKKARTLLTSFAGSIGIIGIALILSISNGVNDYIANEEEDMLYLYPVQVQRSSLNITSLMAETSDEEESVSKKSDEESGITVMRTVTNLFSSSESNDIKALKTYLDSGKSGMEPYVNAIEYTYSVSPVIYRQDGGNIRQVNPDSSFDNLGLSSMSDMGSMLSAMLNTDSFFAMPKESALYEDRYDVLAGRWPRDRTECILVLGSDGTISDYLLYTLGLRDHAELEDMITQFTSGETVDTPDTLDDYAYEDMLGISFKVVNSADCYEYDSEYRLWKDKTDDTDYMKQLVADGEDLTIVGVVQPKDDTSGGVLSTGICYTEELTEYVIAQAKDSAIVKDQRERSDTNIFTNEPFGSEEETAFDLNSLFTFDESALTDAFQFDTDALSDAFSFDTSTLEESLSGALDTDNLTASLSDRMLDFSLSGDDPSSASGSLSLPDMNTLLNNVKFNVTSDAVNDLSSSLLSGYQAYAKTHPEADYSNLAAQFTAYLQSADAQKIISDNLQEILSANGGVQITSDQVQELATSILKGYVSYLNGKGITSLEQLTTTDQYLAEYLATEGAQAILTDWSDKYLTLDSDVTLTADQLSKLAGELANGYSSYAAANGYADLSQISTNLANYLATDEAKSILTESILGMVDTSSLETAINDYLAQIYASYASAIESQMQQALTQIMTQVSANLQTALTQAMTEMTGNVADSLTDSMANAITIDEDTFFNAFQMNMDGDSLSELFTSLASGESNSYDGNLTTLGYADTDDPDSIDIYPKDFESKDQVTAILDNYNASMEAQGKEDQKISYTDTVGTLMSFVTKIINIISYALIAFVGVSLIVSSIMIGVITYISVLERKKEIGILRALGASKNNISQVFNAETGLIGCCSGVLGVGIAAIVLIPGNVLVRHFTGVSDIHAFLSPANAVILIAISIALTLIGGLIPSSRAAKNDPVEALRTE